MARPDKEREWFVDEVLDSGFPGRDPGDIVLKHDNRIPKHVGASSAWSLTAEVASSMREGCAIHIDVLNAFLQLVREDVAQVNPPNRRGATLVVLHRDVLEMAGYVRRDIAGATKPGKPVIVVRIDNVGARKGKHCLHWVLRWAKFTYSEETYTYSGECGTYDPLPSAGLDRSDLRVGWEDMMREFCEDVKVVEQDAVGDITQDNAYDCGAYVAMKIDSLVACESALIHCGLSPRYLLVGRLVTAEYQ